MATTSQSAEASELLRAIGFTSGQISRGRTVYEFQRGFGFGLLATDNDPGEITLSAMRFSAENGGLTTEHFAFREFASRGNGDIVLHRRLPRGLEVVRPDTGTVIASGHRDYQHNINQDGAENSVHVPGGAADDNWPLRIEDVIALGIFSGIGATVDGRWVKHLDVRGVDETVPNYSGGTPGRPTIWGYNAKGRAVAAPKAWQKYLPSTGPGLPPLLTWKVSGVEGTPPVTPIPPDPTPVLTAAVLASIRAKLGRVMEDIQDVRNDVSSLL